MLFRYDFGEKLDLTRFRKQAAHYMGSMNEIIFDLYLLNYKITAHSSSMLGDYISQVTPSDNNAHMVTISLWDLEQSPNKEISNASQIHPLIDTRFKEIKEIKNLFQDYRANLTSNSVQDTVEKICRIIKIVHKIDKLKCFI